jgi:predicted 3-demethylubiquinone-9 3-methyltransferase (glyoxalase superfamily)
MDAKVLPFLMFEGTAEEAMNLYTSLLPDSEILEVERYGPNGPGPEGSVQRAKFEIGGQTVMCIDSFVKHAFAFTASFSFFVECSSESEQAHLSDSLGEGGSVLMPLANYGFSRKFTWFTDRFGVSWQLNLA